MTGLTINALGMKTKALVSGDCFILLKALADFDQTLSVYYCRPEDDSDESDNLIFIRDLSSEGAHKIALPSVGGGIVVVACTTHNAGGCVVGIDV